MRSKTNSGPADLLEVAVPGAEWSSRTGGPLDPVRSNGPWKRKLYLAGYGLGHGALWMEDRVMDWDQPLMPGIVHHTVVVNGRFSAPKTGEYQFSLISCNVITLEVGGKRVVDSRPWEKEVQASGRVRLEEGEHPVECRVYTAGEVKLPGIRVKGPGLIEGYHLGRP